MQCAVSGDAIHVAVHHARNLIATHKKYAPPNAERIPSAKPKLFPKPLNQSHTFPRPVKENKTPKTRKRVLGAMLGLFSLFDTGVITHLSTTA
jgi:hypothetical protein